jgi:hypothetical protein
MGSMGRIGSIGFIGSIRFHIPISISRSYATDRPWLDGHGLHAAKAWESKTLLFFRK